MREKITVNKNLDIRYLADFHNFCTYKQAIPNIRDCLPTFIHPPSLNVFITPNIQITNRL